MAAWFFAGWDDGVAGAGGRRVSWCAADGVEEGGSAAAAAADGGRAAAGFFVGGERAGEGLCGYVGGGNDVMSYGYVLVCYVVMLLWMVMYAQQAAWLGGWLSFCGYGCVQLWDFVMGMA